MPFFALLVQLEKLRFTPQPPMGGFPKAPHGEVIKRYASYTMNDTEVIEAIHYETNKPVRIEIRDGLITHISEFG